MPNKTKRIHTQLLLKHDTKEHWQKAVNYTPPVGEPIVFTNGGPGNKLGLKIGDGITNVFNLPFIGENGEELTPLRISSEIIEETNTIAVPFERAQVSADNLTVYHNGVLLILDANYTYNADTNSIILNGYSAYPHDTFTFLSHFKDIAGVIGNISADQVMLKNPSGTFTSTTVEGALKELKDALNHIDMSSAIQEAKNYTNQEVAKKSPLGHNHDDRYYKKSEVDQRVNGRALASHTHTMSQVSGLQNALDSIIPEAFVISSTHPSNAKQLWFDTNDGNILKYCPSGNTNTWVSVPVAWS